jgi:hypothetical protein
MNSKRAATKSKPGATKSKSETTNPKEMATKSKSLSDRQTSPYNALDPATVTGANCRALVRVERE